MFAALFLILIATLFRVLPLLAISEPSWVMNFSPLAAIVFCGALYFPKRMAIGVPLLILAISDLVLNHFVYSVPFFTWEILPRYGAFFLIGAGTFLLRDKLRHKTANIFGGALAASIVFYLVTNTAAWIGDPAYSKTTAGWIQSMTIGLPGYAPTWTFFRNSLVGDVLFTALFVVSMSLTTRKTVIIPAAVVTAH